MIQSDGLHFMLMHSNHATLMSPLHHCILPDDSKSVAMIRHLMHVVQRVVKLPNPGWKSTCRNTSPAIVRDMEKKSSSFF